NPKTLFSRRCNSEDEYGAAVAPGEIKGYAQIHNSRQSDVTVKRLAGQFNKDQRRMSENIVADRANFHHRKSAELIPRSRGIAGEDHVVSFLPAPSVTGQGIEPSCRPLGRAAGIPAESSIPPSTSPIELREFEHYYAFGI